MKKFTLILAMFFFVSAGFSTNVIPPEQAQRVAKNFMDENVSNRFGLSDFVLKGTTVDKYDDALYYNFAIGKKGFILVSANELVEPILAFSLESDYQGNPGLDFLVSGYTHELELVKANPTAAFSANAQKWDRYSNAQFVPNASKSKSFVEPMIVANWNQWIYYNQYCPFDAGAPGGYDNRVPAGCVAIAMAEILHYYRFPESGTGGRSYVPPPPSSSYSYGRLTVSFKDAHYDYNTMQTNVDRFNGEVGELIYHLGVAVNMGYYTSGSGTSSMIVPIRLKEHFKYNQSALYRDKKVYGAADSLGWQEWLNKIVLPELNARHPLYYSGTQKDNTGGHAWVIDGYMEIDSSFWFHANWGWGGSSNGWFKISNLMNRLGAGGEPISGDENYSYNNATITGLYPDTAFLSRKATSGFQRIIAATGTISDGAGHLKYEPNTHRQWMFAHPKGNRYYFKFEKLKTETNNDVIIIYNGPTTASGIKAKYSGNYLMAACSEGNYNVGFEGQALPNEISVSADSVLVEFITNDNNEVDYGFILSYRVDVKSDNDQCSPSAAVITASDGKISNHKNIENYGTAGLYNPNITCSWRIEPSAQPEQIMFSFPVFHLKAGDVVDIYDDFTPVVEKNLLYRFDINNIPYNKIFICPAKKMKVVFKSDNAEEGKGFILAYGVFASINNFDNVTFNVYPNPASNLVSIKIDNADNDNMFIQVTDLTGRIIHSKNVNATDKNNICTIETHNWAKGLYLVKLSSNKGQACKKLVIE